MISILSRAVPKNTTLRILYPRSIPRHPHIIMPHQVFGAPENLETTLERNTERERVGGAKQQARKGGDVAYSITTGILQRERARSVYVVGGEKKKAACRSKRIAKGDKEKMGESQA